jgi:transposase
LNTLGDFLTFVDVSGSDGCWIWKGAKTPRGYGQARYFGKTWKAHRLSYLFHVGDIPEGMSVCHRCDNPTCVNPSHLFLGTHDDNMQDMRAKGRNVAQPGTKNGRAKLTRNDVIAIREMAATGTRTGTIARQFGVSGQTVFGIVTGREWKHVGGPRTKLVLAGSKAGSAKLTEEQVIEIRRLAAEGASHGEISKKFPVGRSTITRIVNRQMWTHLPAGGTQ